MLVVLIPSTIDENAATNNSATKLGPVSIRVFIILCVAFSKNELPHFVGSFFEVNSS
jgi:hypothetical protein